MPNRRWFVLVGVLVVGVWLTLKLVLPMTVVEGYEPVGPPPWNHPASDVVKDDRPAFRLDPDKPWQIQFGCGSGLHGLETITLDQSGHAVFYRLHHERRRSWPWWDSQQYSTVRSWVTTTAQLPPEAVEQVRAAVEANQLLVLDKEYHANVCDGTQWVLRIKQGDREKAVSFNNHFPDPIVRFSAQLDAIIVGSVGPGLKWRAVPSGHVRDDEYELWQSIKR